MAFTIDSMLNPFKDRPGFNKGIILDSYIKQYELIREKIKWGACKNGDNYVIHVRIPSGDKYCNDVYYDVVFEFFAESQKVKDSKTLTDYSVLVFSNSPSWTFTFTYAYNKYGLIMKWMKDKCNPRCLTEPAVRKNPNSIVGTDTETWFAAYHIQQIGLLHYKARFDSIINTSTKSIHQGVPDQMAMLALRGEVHDKNQLKEKNAKAAQNASKRFASYREQKDFEKAINASNLREKVNPASLSKKLAKAAREARDYRARRMPKKVKTHR